MSLREKTLLLPVIETIIRRRGCERNEEELGRIADEIEEEANERIAEMREEDQEVDGCEELGKLGWYCR